MVNAHPFDLLVQMFKMYAWHTGLSDMPKPGKGKNTGCGGRAGRRGLGVRVLWIPGQASASPKRAGSTMDTQVPEPSREATLNDAAAPPNSINRLRTFATP